MDSHHFDTLVKHLYVLKSRREGLRALFAVVTAGTLSLANPSPAAACKSRGRPCTQENQCCSGVCGNKKKVKKKSGGFKKEKVGKCSCSLPQEPCNASSDCCSASDACGFTDCEEHKVCCTAAGLPCGDDCECCGFNVCDEDSNTCQPRFCSETQEPCRFTSDCCNDDEERCLAIDPDCEGRVGDKQCCVLAGGECEEDCDCCIPFECDEDLGECVNPASTCEPTQIVCAEGKFKPCCDAEFPHCCDPDAAAGCCQTGFPVCCGHENPPGVACCPEGAKCCEPGDKQLCCPEDQGCCPAGSALGCGQSLAECENA